MKKKNEIRIATCWPIADGNVSAFQERVRVASGDSSLSTESPVSLAMRFRRLTDGECTPRMMSLMVG
jgi:hypothetical protein